MGGISTHPNQNILNEQTKQEMDGAERMLQQSIEYAKFDHSHAMVMLDYAYEKAENYRRLGFYEGAFHEFGLALSYNIPSEERVKLHLARAEMKLLLKQYTQARVEIDETVRYGLSFKALKLSLDITSEEHSPNHAIVECWKFYNLPLKRDLRIQTVKELVIRLVSNEGILDVRVIHHIHTEPEDSILEQVVIELSKTNHWKEVAYLLLGLFPDSSVMCGAARFCQTAEISVVRLLRYFQGKFKAWVDELASFIIKKGSPIEQLFEIYHQPPLHTVAEIAVQSGYFELYKFIAKLYREWGRLCTKNKEGLTVVGYLEKKGYKTSPNYERFLQIFTRIKDSEPKGGSPIIEDFLSIKAKTAVEYANHKTALQYYMEILENLDEDNFFQRARFSRNISLVYSYLSQHEKALEFADKALALNPAFEKAYWRKAQALEDLKRPHLACQVYLKGLPHTENPSEYLSKAFKLFENNVDQLKKKSIDECLALFQNVESSLSDEFLYQCSINGKWPSIKLLVLGPTNSRPLVKCFNASRVSFLTLYKKLEQQQSLRKSCHLMLLELLKHGAEIQTLSKNEYEVLHVLVKITLLIDSVDVLEYILKRNPWKQMATDDLLHTAVRNGNAKSEVCFKVIYVLLQKGMNPKAKDSHGKTVSYYIKEDFTKTGALLHIYEKDFELKSEFLEKRGDECLKDKLYYEASSFYTVALAVLGQKKENSEFAGRLHGSRSQCFLGLKKYSRASDDASFFLKCCPKSYQAHQQMSKVFAPHNQIKAYEHLHKAYSLMECTIEDPNKMEIVQELCRMKYKLGDTSLEDMRLVDVTRAGLNFMKSNAFNFAEFNFEIIFINSVWPFMDTSSIDIGVFCSEEAILYKGSMVFQRVLIMLIDKGADLRNLSLYKGDTYLHAASILASRIGYLDLLDYLLQNRAIPLSEVNVLDKYEKTSLFRLWNEPNSPFKMNAISILLENGAEHEISLDQVKTLSKDSYLLINDTCTRPANQKVQNSTFPKKTSSKLSSSASKVDDASQAVDPCSYCQKLYNCALKKHKSGYDSNQIVQSLVELCQIDHRRKTHEEWVSKSVNLIVSQLDDSGSLAIPTCLLSIKASVFLKIVQELAFAKKWKSMHQCFESYQQKKGSDILKNFASKLTVADFLDSVSFKQEAEIHEKILTCLINNGATCGTDPKLKKNALEVCFAKEEYRAIVVLLKYGLDPLLISLSAGDTPLHAAAEIGLRKDIGYFGLFEYLLKLYVSDPEKYPDLSILRVDKQKQTLNHVACRIKYSKHSLWLIEICYKHGVPSDLPDAAGKIPYQYISKNPNDRRIGYLARISSQTTRTVPPSNSSKVTELTPNSEPLVVECQKRAEYKAEKKESVKSVLKEMITCLDDHRCKDLHIVSFQKQKKNKTEKYSTYKTEDEVQVDGDLQVSGDSDVGEDVSDDLVTSNMFDKLEWEVECTSNVWKTLHDRKMPYKKRKQAVLKIQHLASGDWQRASNKKVKNMPQTLKLFTIKLSRTSYIVWELAIAFSPRYSCVKQFMDHDVINGESVQGQVYTEVIRVWSVVFDLKDLKHVLGQIAKSHQRGETCLVQKQLENISDEHKTSCGDSTKRLPQLFTEKQIEDHQMKLQPFCPPVSDKFDEYNVIKFYSFSTALVSSVLQNDSSPNVDFPFQVTELEHRIINLTTTAPIILLGRSGTGKTTCCLYRLWMNFVSYWHRADLAGSPLYPVHVVETALQTDAAEIARPVEQDPEDVSDEVSDKETDELPTKESRSSPCEDEGIPNSSDLKESHEFVHLHQVFVTKNSVLCNEVDRNFQELRRGSEIIYKYKEVEDILLPSTFQDVKDNHFPMFLTSKKLWIILDASLDTPYFFARNKNGSLKHDIFGWSNEDDHLVSLPNIDDYEGDAESFALPYGFLAQQTKTANQRQEITYEKFLEIWPDINKPVSGYHPSLVWTEIISFIKGSFEALHTQKGYLSEEDYLNIGRKRAPNFNGEREKVYEIFLRYLIKKKQKRMFDEADVVFNLYQRLQKEKQFPCPLHEIYVDETQDFTQAELCLLLQLSENPNHMFLTGDTAQSIMRGVSFRFSELKSLFYFAEQHAASVKGQSKIIHAPKYLHKLLHNYRTHQGILKLASSIIDVLLRYFPESFDQMEKDQGLFNGPKPKLLESCSLTDLAMLLRRDKHQTSHIEFGAHQAILVVNNESREKLPEELSTALVLTIFEAKGLEFDDVLLYNFFKDSQASKEWRVVTEFLNDLINKPKTDEESLSQDSLVKINWDILQEASRPRPLPFNSNQHKILNSELKLLYTALTRARVNLWIFDTDIDKRAPMFDYFKALDLIETINTNNLQDKDINKLMFAEHSTPEMWLQRGHDFSRKSLFNIAAKCYHYGNHLQYEKFALANHHALTAQRCQDVPNGKEHFMQAAKFYMESDQHIQAAKCLERVKERVLSAELFEKCEEYEFAGNIYVSMQNSLKASECFERCQLFDKAVKTLHDDKMYDNAVDVIRRYNVLLQSYGERDVPENLISHKPLQDINYLCYCSADSHHRKRNLSKMQRALDQLPLGEKIEFLEKKQLIDLAADILFKEGQLEESVKLLCRNGKYEKSIECARGGSDNLLGSCLYTFAQFKYAQLMKSDATTDVVALRQETTVLLEEAKACYQRMADTNGCSLCLLLLSKINQNVENAIEALEGFCQIRPHPNAAGSLQCASLLMECMQSTEHNCAIYIMKSVEMGYLLLKDMKSGASIVSLPLLECLEHFGFHIINNQTVCIYPKLDPLVTVQLEPLMLTITGSSSQYPLAEIKEKLYRHFLNLIQDLFLCARMTYMLHLSSSIQCPLYMAGYQCTQGEECSCPLRKIGLFCSRPDSNCQHRHDPYTEKAFTEAITLTLRIMQMDHGLISQVSEEDFACMEKLNPMLDENLYKTSKLLLSLLTPAVGNAFPLKGHSQFRSLKKSLLSCRKCAIFVRNYLFATWKTTKSKNIPVSNFFLKCPILIGCFGLKIFQQRWVQELHRPVNQEQSIMIFSKGFNFCIYKFFVDSLYYLFEKSDPFESLIKFTKYTGFLLQEDMVFPHLDVLLFWCEFFVFLAMMLNLKNRDGLNMALPESYVIQSFFIDCLQKNPSFSLQKAVETSEPLSFRQMKILQDRVGRLVNIIIHRDVLKIAQKTRYVTSGVTERFVVLGLLLLSNIGRGVPGNLTKCIINAILSLNVIRTIAPRLKKALQQLSLAEGSLDSVLILSDLLTERGDRLCQYKWRYDPQTCQGLQCYFKTSSTPISLDSFKINSPTTCEEADYSNYDLEEEEDEDGFTESEKSQARESYEKHKAVTTITRAYLAYKFRVSCNQIAAKVSDYLIRVSKNQVDYFTDIKLNEASCNICGVSFASVPIKSEMSLEKTLTNSNNSIHLEEETLRKSKMDEHKRKSSHKENEIKFQRCVKKYRQEFAPVIKQAQEIITKQEPVKHSAEVEYYLNQLNNKVARIDQKTSQMCKKASWRDFRSLESQLEELKKTLANIDKKLAIEQIQNASENRNHVKSAISEEKEIQDDLNHSQDIVLEPKFFQQHASSKQERKH